VTAPPLTAAARHSPPLTAAAGMVPVNAAPPLRGHCGARTSCAIAVPICAPIRTVRPAARALVRDPSVLILDEATSALDAVTERKVLNRLRGLRCTRIIVAHRLSTIVEADSIIVLQAGRVVGIGPHATLLTRCPAYRELVRSQTGNSMNTQAPATLDERPQPVAQLPFKRHGITSSLAPDSDDDVREHEGA
jgi:ABC-type antimicrobial peptide transport system ATPase subunit